MVYTYQVVSSYIGSEFEVFIMFCDIVISKSINVSHNTLTYPILSITKTIYSDDLFLFLQVKKWLKI